MSNSSFDNAFKSFSITFEKMRMSLSEWVLKNNGGFDTEGAVTGLTDNNMIHFQSRNTQLESIITFFTESNNRIEQLKGQCERLKFENQMLKVALREQSIKDEDLRRNIEIYMAYEITEDTTLKDFIETMKDTFFYLDLAVRKKVLENTPSVQNRIKAAQWFTEDEKAAEKHYFKKIKILRGATPEVKKIINDEYDK